MSATGQLGPSEAIQSCRHSPPQAWPLQTTSRICSSDHSSARTQRSLRGSDCLGFPQRKTQDLTPNVPFDLPTNSVENLYCNSTPSANLPEPQIPLGVIDWQERQDAIVFQSRYPYNPYDPYDNALLPFAPIDYISSNMDNIAAVAEHPTISAIPLAYSPNPAPQSMSAGSSSKSGLEDVSSKPGSSSASSSRVEKRKANTLAARRYRQNRLDKVSELESALKATQLERDALKVQVAMLQGETQALREIVGGARVENS